MAVRKLLVMNDNRWKFGLYLCISFKYKIAHST